MIEYLKEIIILLFISVLAMLFCAYKANNSKEITDVIRYLAIMIILCALCSILTITLININLINEQRENNMVKHSNYIDSSNTIIEELPETDKRRKQNISKPK